MMFASARKLREAGVLGLNERNAEFIMRLNPRRLYPRVDDKALTKQLALEAGMPRIGELPFDCVADVFVARLSANVQRVGQNADPADAHLRRKLHRTGDGAGQGDA